MKVCLSAFDVRKLYLLFILNLNCARSVLLMNRLEGWLTITERTGVAIGRRRSASVEGDSPR